MSEKDLDNSSPFDPIEVFERTCREFRTKIEGALVAVAHSVEAMKSINGDMRRENGHERDTHKPGNDGEDSGIST